jgi:hypothetical protein
VDDFNDKAKYIKVYPSTPTAISRAVSGSYNEDLELFYVGFVLLVLYSFLVLG